MSEFRGNEQLVLALSCQTYAEPTSKGGGGDAQIDNYVKDFACSTPYQSELRCSQVLVVESTHNALTGPRVIVLNEIEIAQSMPLEFAPVITLEKEPPLVLEEFRFDDEDAFDIGLNNMDVHGSNSRTMFQSLFTAW